MSKTFGSRKLPGGRVILNILDLSSHAEVTIYFSRKKWNNNHKICFCALCVFLDIFPETLFFHLLSASYQFFKQFQSNRSQGKIDLLSMSGSGFEIERATLELKKKWGTNNAIKKPFHVWLKTDKANEKTLLFGVHFLYCPLSGNLRKNPLCLHETKTSPSPWGGDYRCFKQSEERLPMLPFVLMVMWKYAWWQIHTRENEQEKHGSQPTQETRRHLFSLGCPHSKPPRTTYFDFWATISPPPSPQS